MAHSQQQPTYRPQKVQTQKEALEETKDALVMIIIIIIYSDIKNIYNTTNILYNVNRIELNTRNNIY